MYATKIKEYSRIATNDALTALSLERTTCNFTEDMEQAAQVKIWKLFKDTQDYEYQKRYLIKAGYRAALDEYFKLRFEVRHHSRTQDGINRTILSNIMFENAVSKNSVIEENIGYEKLVDFFLSLKKQRGNRNVQAAEREALICILIERNASNREIADIMDMDIQAVKRCRYRLRDKLNEYLNPSMNDDYEDDDEDFDYDDDTEILLGASTLKKLRTSKPDFSDFDVD